MKTPETAPPPLSPQVLAPPTPASVTLKKEWLEALAEWAERLSLDAQALATQSRKILDTMDPNKPIAKPAPKKS